MHAGQTWLEDNIRREYNAHAILKKVKPSYGRFFEVVIEVEGKEEAVLYDTLTGHVSMADAEP